jgi:hypothetical protein
MEPSLFTYVFNWTTQQNGVVIVRAYNEEHARRLIREHYVLQYYADNEFKLNSYQSNEPGVIWYYSE